VILTAGGIPLIYLGDEIGTLNDYTYRDDPAHERDSRWVHRPRADWEKYAKRNDSSSIEGRVYQGLQNLIVLRKAYEAFSGGEMEITPTENEHVLGFMRTHTGNRAVIFANFSESPQTIPARVLEQHSVRGKKILHGISKILSREDMIIEPLDFLVFGI
ncbi:MAG: amylosucrase, partial [Anaerolineales bacterium]